MYRDTETLLKQVIEKDLKDLGDIELGTEEYKAAVDGITKMADRLIEMNKIDLEYEDRLEAREKEEELRREEMKESRKNHRISDWLTVLGIAVPAGLTVWGTIKSFEFEKDGTITTIMGRGFIQKLIPKK